MLTRLALSFSTDCFIHLYFSKNSCLVLICFWVFSVVFKSFVVICYHSEIAKYDKIFGAKYRCLCIYSTSSEILQLQLT